MFKRGAFGEFLGVLARVHLLVFDVYSEHLTQGGLRRVFIYHVGKNRRVHSFVI